MVVMDVKLDNIFGFEDFNVNFSFPKQLVNSPIGLECLKGCPSFRYKKVVVIMGPNASGKTTFGKALMAIFNFVAKKNTSLLTSDICDKTKPASFAIELVDSSNTMFRICAVITPPANGTDYLESNFKVSMASVSVKSSDTYERCKGYLDTELKDAGSYLAAFNSLANLGWHFTFPGMGSSFVKFSQASDDVFEKTLETVLRTLDPAIISVNKSSEIKDSYVINHKAFQILIKDGEVINSDALSSGTIKGIDIAIFLTSIIQHSYGFYYCDEKFSFIQSNLEKSILSLMIDNLSSGEQLFFTTHSSDTLDMNMPHHSFLFLRKDSGGITAEFADKYLKRNTDNLRNAVENDLFGTNPNLSLLDKLDNTVE